MPIKSLLISAITGLILSATAVKTTAQTIELNLNSVDASAGPVDATSFLASYGISLSSVMTTDPTGPGYTASVDIEANSGGNSDVELSSPPNFLIELPSGPPPAPADVTYTMNFSTPLTSFSFERGGDPEGDSETPPWSVTAYVGNMEVDSVGSPYFDSWTGQGPETFTLTGDGITSITISASGYNNGVSPAGIASIPMDEIILTPVPEPTTLALAGLSGSSLLLFHRRKT